MTTPELGTILLASREPARLRDWYTEAFGVEVDVDGFFRFGAVGLLVVPRDDVAAATVEPGRVLVSFHVSDIAAVTDHLRALGAPTVAPLEYRDDGGAWFATFTDPDGNLVQVIELGPTYWVKRRARIEGAEGRAAGPLEDASVATRLPAQDLDRARRFYAEVLGLEPTETREGGLRYECGGTSFVVFASTGRPSGDHTQMAITVPDVDAAVAELGRRGVEIDDAGIVDIEGHYPSTGATGERATWFHDSEGNLLGISELVRPPRS